MLIYNYPRFSIGTPDGWSDRTMVALVQTSDRAYDASISIESEALEVHVSSEDYAAEQLDNMLEDLAEFSYQLLEEGPVVVADEQGYQRFQAFRLPDDESSDGILVQQWQIYMVFGTEAVTITCTDTADNFQNTYPSFVEAVNQFRYHGQG